MSHSVLSVTNEILNNMKEHYQTSLVNQNPPGSLFVAKPSGCTITAYKSGKVLFQGKAAETEALKWEMDGKKSEVKGTTPKSSSSKSTTSKSTNRKYTPPANISQLSIIGSDEVGTGDYFGPMTVVAAYVTSEKIQLLKELGVKDSKDLNDTQITNIAKEIISMIPYSLLILRNGKYNELEKSGINQGKMKALLHNQAIHHVFKKLNHNHQVDGILIDQFCEPGVFFNYLKGKEISWKSESIYFSTKAEGIHIAVAAASIIARYAFIKEFEKLSEMAGFVLPKGAGSKVDQCAAELIRKHGEKALLDFTKFHFANTEKARKLV